MVTRNTLILIPKSYLDRLVFSISNRLQPNRWNHSTISISACRIYTDLYVTNRNRNTSVSVGIQTKSGWCRAHGNKCDVTEKPIVTQSRSHCVGSRGAVTGFCMLCVYMHPAIISESFIVPRVYSYISIKSVLSYLYNENYYTDKMTSLLEWFDLVWIQFLTMYRTHL